jgi:hypothetical protein
VGARAAGTPFERQQWEAMNQSDGPFVVLTDAERDELAAEVVAELVGWTYLAC